MMEIISKDVLRLICAHLDVFSLGSLQRVNKYWWNTLKDVTVRAPTFSPKDVENIVY